MAEGAKMAGASQGTAQQRAFTQEGGRKGCMDPKMVDLSFLTPPRRPRTECKTGLYAFFMPGILT